MTEDPHPWVIIHHSTIPWRLSQAEVIELIKQATNDNNSSSSAGPPKATSRSADESEPQCLLPTGVNMPIGEAHEQPVAILRDNAAD